MYERRILFSNNQVEVERDEYDARAIVRIRAGNGVTHEEDLIPDRNQLILLFCTYFQQPPFFENGFGDRNPLSPMYAANWIMGTIREGIPFNMQVPIEFGPNLRWRTIGASIEKQNIILSYKEGLQEIRVLNIRYRDSVDDEEHFWKFNSYEELINHLIRARDFMQGLKPVLMELFNNMFKDYESSIGSISITNGKYGEGKLCFDVKRKCVHVNTSNLVLK